MLSLASHVYLAILIPEAINPRRELLAMSSYVQNHVPIYQESCVLIPEAIIPRRELLQPCSHLPGILRVKLSSGKPATQAPTRRVPKHTKLD